MADPSSRYFPRAAGEGAGAAPYLVLATATPPE